MDKYLELYRNDSRFQRYVDACVKEEKKSLEEVLAMRVIQNVGDYYIANPPKEEAPTVAKMKSGGC